MMIGFRMKIVCLTALIGIVGARRFKSDYDPVREMGNYDLDVMCMGALREFNQDCARQVNCKENQLQFFLLF
jgi:hypothetical protein